MLSKATKLNFNDSELANDTVEIFSKHPHKSTTHIPI